MNKENLFIKGDFMSTNANISIYNEETKELKVIYCHWDGYLEETGKKLSKFYTNKEKVEELISNGYLSFLEKNISPPLGEKHSFKKPFKDTCVFFKRDRGDINVDAKIFNHVEFDKIYKYRSCEFMYVFLKDNETGNYNWWHYDNKSIDLMRVL